MPFTAAAVARALDHAVLRPEYTSGDLAAHAAMCVDRGVGCICVRPCDVAAAARLVAGSPVAVASVIGFPHGNHRPETKALEARLALADGARELDMVMNIGRLLSGDHTAVRDDIAAVVGEAKPRSGLVKVILETCFLSPSQIATACLLAEQAGADFVKTSTGYGTDGATPEAVRIMLDTVGGRLGVKASGGIRTWNDAVMYLDMGCTRLGVGDAARILDGA
jgi:deoxyribose-phosphate aldolase